MWQARPYLALVPFILLGLALVAWGSNAPSQYGQIETSSIPQLAQAATQSSLQGAHQVAPRLGAARRQSSSRSTSRQYGAQASCRQSKCKSTRQRKREGYRLPSVVQDRIRFAASNGYMPASNYGSLDTGPVALTSCGTRGSHGGATSAAKGLSGRQAIQEAQWQFTCQRGTWCGFVNVDEHYRVASGWTGTAGPGLGRKGGCQTLQRPARTCGQPWRHSRLSPRKSRSQQRSKLLGDPYGRTPRSRKCYVCGASHPPMWTRSQRSVLGWLGQLQRLLY